MASHKDYQENVNPLQNITNGHHPSLAKSEPPRTTLPTSKPPGAPSKPQIKNIQNGYTLTSAFKLMFSQRAHAPISDESTKRPITGGMPPNVEHIIQPHPNSKIAEVVTQHQAICKNASSTKRQRLEKVDDADDIYIIQEIIKRPRESTDAIQEAQSHNEQAISPPAIEVVPTNSSIRAAPEVLPTVASTPHALEREQQNNGTRTFARNRAPNNDEEFFESLKLENIRLRKKEVKRLESISDGRTDSVPMQELQKKINILKRGIEWSERIRLDIAENKSIMIHGKYTCKKCNKGYEKPGNIFNHVLDSHREIFEEYKLARTNEAARTHNRDDTSSLASHSHSIHSQRTSLGSNVSPHKDELSADFNMQKGNCNQVQTKTDPIGENIPSSSGRKVIVNAPIEHVPVKTTDPRAHLQTVVEITQDNPLWRRLDINFAPRKSVDFLGHKSFDHFYENDKKIRNLLKKIKPNSFATSTNKTKNTVSQQMPKRNNLTFLDGSTQVKKYYFGLLYTKAELDKINHCYTNKNIDDLCKSCTFKLVEFQAKQYAVSKAAYDEHDKITKNRSLSDQQKKKKIKELFSTKDEYSLIRDRIQKVNAKRGSFNLLPIMVRYNRNYFLLLQKAFNDMKIRDFVQLDRSNSTRYKFGIYCSKLMDDIVNEFLVQVTVTCMNFAYQQRNVTLTKELLSQHLASFKMINKDATYLEPCLPEMQKFYEKNYLSFLPKPKDLEILIIDCLLRHCFGDENTMHVNLDDLIFEHLKSPQPIFKFLMYMRITEPYLKMIRTLLLKFLSQLAVEVLKLKKETESNDLVTFEELIEACEIVGVFGSSYIHYLRKSYTHYFESFLHKSQK